MHIVSWNSRLPFRELKKKVTEAKNAAPKKAEHKWEFLLLWRFLLIHYLGPVVMEETSHDGFFYNLHHCFVIGFCFSRAGKTKMLALALYDYILGLILVIWTFFGPYLGSGSVWCGVFFSVGFLLLFSWMSKRDVKLLLSGIKLFLGFDNE